MQYTLRFAPKEVVILLVLFPTEPATSTRKDVQAIFNSLKMVGAAGDGESWLSTPEAGSDELSKSARYQDSAATPPASKPEGAASADLAAGWPCAIDDETRAVAAKAQMGPAKTIPGTDVSIRFPTGWIQDTGKWANKTLIVFNNPDKTARIAVYGRHSTGLAAYVKTYKQKAKTTFRESSTCPYEIYKTASGTATVFELRGPEEDDFETHAVFAFPRKGSTTGEVTLVDCITSGQMEPNERGQFQASLQNLKLPGATSPGAGDAQATPAESAGKFSGLFLRNDDFSGEMKRTENNELKKEPLFTKLRGEFAALSVWMAADLRRAIWRVVDLRWVFPDDKSAHLFLTHLSTSSRRAARK